MENSGLKREAFKEFVEFLKCINLKDLVLLEQNFKRKINIPMSNETNVIINSETKINKIREHIQTNILYKIVFLNSNKDEFVKIQIKYALLFKLKKDKEEKASELMNNVEVMKIFSKIQVPKLTWGFLRADIYNLCSRAGIKPPVLDLLK